MYRHDPVFVEEVENGERVPAGVFCNYACLTSCVADEGLTTGACCEWNPE
ncbi:hypothetical protein [Haloferax profundi]|nr:hypothetical protein [Haloferax profundi]